MVKPASWVEFAPLPQVFYSLLFFIISKQELFLQMDAAHELRMNEVRRTAGTIDEVLQTEVGVMFSNQLQV